MINDMGEKRKAFASIRTIRRGAPTDPRAPLVGCSFQAFRAVAWEAVPC